MSSIRRDQAERRKRRRQDRRNDRSYRPRPDKHDVQIAYSNSDDWDEYPISDLGDQIQRTELYQDASKEFDRFYKRYPLAIALPVGIIIMGMQDPGLCFAGLLVIGVGVYFQFFEKDRTGW